jgi:hypothetical protein
MKNAIKHSEKNVRSTETGFVQNFDFENGCPKA